MPRKIEKAGVIGSGVMGAALAAQLANAGIKTMLLDIIPPKLSEEDQKKGLTFESPAFRNKLADRGLGLALKSKPAAFYLPENTQLISLGNIDDDLPKLREVDWIIEAVVERLDIKQSLYEKLEAMLKPDTIVTSNTSGISAKALGEKRSKNFQEHFAVTHFFNPPRYMKLLELVAGPDTLAEVMETLAWVCERKLGKGVVYAKDTPNFIANRIGIFSLLYATQVMLNLGLSIEAVDQLTGPVIGRPKSASFRTADLVGLDTLVHVADNVYNAALQDEMRAMFKIPDFMQQMLAKNMLGEKTRQGFYKKTNDPAGKPVILSLDYKNLEYSPQKKVDFMSLEMAKNTKGVAEKLKSLYYTNDLAGQFTFQTLTETLIYAANRVGEITDDLLSIDRAMQWGYAWEMGPFEIWDAIGLTSSLAKMRKSGYIIPAWVQALVDSGQNSFYKRKRSTLSFYDLIARDYAPVPIKPGVILLPALKDRQKKVAGNQGASLVDLGDGVACFEFHTKMNAMGEEIITMLLKALEIVEKDFEGLIIANHGNNFSAGANLPLVLFMTQEEEWDELEWAIKTFQDVFMKMKYLSKPVVAAPAGLTLGGGCEICLAADRVQFAAETYMGLVEAGIGVVPAGGGTKELLLRNTEHLFEIQPGGVYPKQIELMPFVARAFETIAMAKVSTSGPEAIKLGYLRATDKMTINRDFQIEDAKKTVLAMNLEGYKPPLPQEAIRVAGQNTFAMLKLAVWTLHEQGFATEHDLAVAEKVAYILCGGKVQADTRVTEQYLLDLEREAFLSLCGTSKTQARIEYMLKTGKPLRN